MLEITRKKPGKESTILPQRKQLILNFIHEFRRVREVSPTFVEIAKGIGYTPDSGGTAFTFVEELIQEGWLKRAQAGSRSILPTYPPEKQYCEVTDPELKRILKQQRNLRILRRM